MQVAKEDFVRALEEIRKLYEVQDMIEFTGAGRVTMGNGVVHALIDLLDHQMGCCGWVDYWVHDADFGRNDKALIHEISIKSAEELYDYLVSMN